MEHSEIDPTWPNSLRWFLAQDLTSFTPWHFITEAAERDFASEAFRREDVNCGEVLAIARRQDCDDFAGLEVVDGRITEKVIYFHPVFGDGSRQSPRTWNIVIGSFEDVFEFVRRRVVPDMKDWAREEDAADL